MHSFRLCRAFADPAAGLPADPIHYKRFHQPSGCHHSAVNLLTSLKQHMLQSRCLHLAGYPLARATRAHPFLLMYLACSPTSGNTYPDICRSRQIRGDWKPAGISIAGLGLLASEAPVSLVGWQLSISAAPSVLQPVTTLCIHGTSGMPINSSGLLPSCLCWRQPPQPMSWLVHVCCLSSNHENTYLILSAGKHAV